MFALTLQANTPGRVTAAARFVLRGYEEICQFPAEDWHHITSHFHQGHDPLRR